MFDYQSLTKSDNEIYLKVPASSRPQEFILYDIVNNPQNSLNDLANNFDYKYLTLQKNQRTLVLIPFAKSLSDKQVKTIDFEFLTDSFKRMDAGHAYRDRGSNPEPFVLHNENKPLINAKKYVTEESSYFNSDKIKEGLESFVKTAEFKKIYEDKVQLRNFLHTLANDVYKKMYTQNDLDMILKILQPFVKNISKEYNVAYQEISNSTALRERTQPFGQYLKLYLTGDSKAQNIAEQLLSTLNEDFEPNSKLNLEVAGNLISQVYQPALLKNNGRDRDNVVIFNPLEGVWVHNEDTYNSLLMAVRPYSKAADLNTLISTFAAQARNKNAFIEPYHQSQHLLFLNTVLDVKTMITYDLNSNYVRNLHFTERTQIHINYDAQVNSPPDFPGKRRSDGGVWDPLNFFSAYCDNDPDKLDFLMFCLSLPLFAGHNFGVHLDIRGESRWGKTTLSEIYKALFPHQVFEIIYSKLNEQFGFTNYNPQTSVIWIRECNTEAAPLNDEYGVPVYDALADNQASLQVKSQSDLEIQNPPQVIIDGTAYVKAKDMSTGPAGRTFVFKLPMEDDPDVDNPIINLTNQAYANDISALLSDETVLQYLVNQMINAYRTELKLGQDNINRLWSLKLNFGGKSSDLALLPDFAQKWRKEMTQTQGGDIQEWFQEEFAKFFSDDPGHPTKMHDDLAYSFYRNEYEARHSMQDPNNQSLLPMSSFKKQFSNLLKEAGWEKVNAFEKNGRSKRQINNHLSNLNFKVQDYQDEGLKVPEEYTDANIDSDHPMPAYPLGRRVTGWYELIKEPDPNTTLTSDKNN